MIVVADTSPLNYLIQIEAEILLPHLYGQVLIPSGVLKELRQDGAPVIVREWIDAIPTWLVIIEVSSETDASLSRLGLGEREAIQLAEDRGADLLLIDERKGRLEASARGLATTGTLGVLIAAGDMGLIDASEAYRRLVAETTFRTSPSLEVRFLERVGRLRP